MNNKTYTQNIKEKILRIENHYSVNQWVINGIHIWPYVRIKLYIFLLNYESYETFQAAEVSLKKKQKGKNIVRKILIPFRLVIAFITLQGFYSKLKRKKILFFGSHFHRTKHPEGYFNRFFDSMVNVHKLQDEVYTLEFEKVFEKNYNQKAIIPLHKYLDAYKLLKKASFVRKSKAEVKLKNYKEFYLQLEMEYHEIKSLRIADRNLIAWCNKVQNTKGFFIRLYKKIQPSKIIFLSYYGFDDLSAAILAAHEMGVKTIDFQHGPQTNVHMAYSSWTKHPEAPYNIMPVEYWNWDEKSKNNIDEWAKKSEQIVAKVVGQPYLGYSLKNFKIDNTREPVIFYSLQTFALADMFPLNLIDTIKNTQLHWIIRMHPRSGFNEQELKTYLDQNIDKSRYTIENSMGVPLPETLAKSILHVTNFSGCLIEAQMMGVPTVIFHPEGQEMFSKYIDNELVFYLDRSDFSFENQFNAILKKVNTELFQVKRYAVANPLEV